MTWEVISKLMGVSRQRVHQIGTGYRSPSSSHRVENPLDIKVLNARKREALGIFSGINPIKNGGRDIVRELVRIRDNRMCQICKIEWQEGTRRLDVHHLDEEHEGRSFEKGHTKWDRKNMDKMITLCHRCHMNLDEVRKKMGIGERKSTWKLDKKG